MVLSVPNVQVWLLSFTLRNSLFDRVQAINNNSFAVVHVTQVGFIDGVRLINRVYCYSWSSAIGIVGYSCYNAANYVYSLGAAT